jgi:hypothetical protein
MEGSFEEHWFQRVEQRVFVEELAVFRARQDFEDNVFYISDYVSKEGVRSAEPVASHRVGPHAEKVKRHVASHVEQKEIDSLKVKPKLAPEQEEPAPMMRTYQISKEADKKKKVFIVFHSLLL